MKLSGSLLKFILPVLLLFYSHGKVCAQEKPNILFIIVDDLRPELGTYGHQFIQSPNIDRLADEGVRFDRAYCNVPVCGASRASLLSGIRPYWPKRFLNYKTKLEEECAEVITLPQLFKNNGYTTISNGKVFHHKNDMAQSWSEKPWKKGFSRNPNDDNSAWLNPASKQKINPETGNGPYFETAEVPDSAYVDGQTTLKSIRDLERLAAEKKPFFLAVGFSKPHLPFNAPQKYFDLYPEVELANNRFPIQDLPEQCTNSKEIFVYGGLEHYNQEEFHREARRAYYACVSYIDAQVGLLLQKLQELDLDNNTIVVLLGDHGWHLGEHNFWGKHNALHNSLHSPLIIKVPAITGPVNEIVEFVDVYPTLAELAGLPLPAHLHGESMKALMQGNATDWKNLAYTEWQGARTIITPQYAYSQWFEPKNKGVHMLFDHRKDPLENMNVVEEPEYGKVVKQHQQLIQELYQKLSSTCP